MELVERTPVDELGGIGVEWLAREAPPLIAAILGALAEPASAGERALHPAELRRASELRQLRNGTAAPARIPRDLAALQTLLIEALRRSAPPPSSPAPSRAWPRSSVRSRARSPRSWSASAAAIRRGTH